MNLADITPLILTYNEEPNIVRCLERLRWASQVIVLDSISTDGTERLARSFPNVTFLQRPFDDHATQWNHGTSHAATPWVLALDCDYILEESFEDELAMLTPGTSITAYRSGFIYAIYGRNLRGSLYPPRIVLFLKDKCTFEKDGHTQALRVQGNIGDIRHRIIHDDRKPLTRWLISQDKYAMLEAEKLLVHDGRGLAIQDRIRRTLVLGPPAVVFYTLIIRGTLFDGLHGWFYAFQRMLAEIILSLRLLERRILARNLGGP
jgi:glycosyltransferase involved in cell wall biosynthesis